MTMPQQYAPVIAAIRETLDREIPILESIPENILSERRNAQNRTIKQLLGHLVDSASNNHQRMVRLQYTAHLVFPDYTQDNDRWIAIQDYQSADWHDLIQLWKYYNFHIIRVIRSVDPATLDNEWTDFEGNRVTLHQMIEGYTGHLNLHLNEIKALLQE